MFVQDRGDGDICGGLDADFLAFLTVAADNLSVKFGLLTEVVALCDQICQRGLDTFLLGKVKFHPEWLATECISGVEIHQ